jgi:F1F0 ATPase subunit 2
MSSVIDIVAPLLTGLAAGLVFFEGLWWTTRRLLTARAPWRLLMLSFVLRSTIVVGGVILVSAGQWQRLAVAVGGVLLARTVVLHCHRLAPSPSVKEPPWS